ncbi:MAG: hypothetical protein PVI90_00580 [Desulfobacteraceae bacterium]|jgi:hypothetical protein
MTNNQLHYLINKRRFKVVVFQCNRKILESSNELFVAMPCDIQWHCVIKTLNKWLNANIDTSFEKVIIRHENMYITETLAKLDVETVLRNIGKRNLWLAYNERDNCYKEIIFHG